MNAINQHLKSQNPQMMMFSIRDMVRPALTLGRTRGRGVMPPP